MINLDDDTLIYMLGYITPKQWVDALSCEDLDKEIINNLLAAVDNRYKGIKAEVDDKIKELVVERLSK